MYEINKRGGGTFFCGGWNFLKSVSMGSAFIRELRVVSFDKGPLKRNLLNDTKLILNNQGGHSEDPYSTNKKTIGNFFVSLVS